MSKKSVKLIVVVIVLVCSGGIIQASSIPSPLTLEYLLNTPIADLKPQLGKFDIAEVNLACAEGLAGSEDLDKKARLETLDKWTQHIRRETERCLPQFYQDKGYYYGSLNYYKILMLVTVLHQDFGVGYNMDLVNSGILYDFTTTKFNASSKDVFVHGLLADKRTGSCASMPVLVVAIIATTNCPITVERVCRELGIDWYRPRKLTRGLMVRYLRALIVSRVFSATTSEETKSHDIQHTLDNAA